MKKISIIGLLLLSAITAGYYASVQNQAQNLCCEPSQAGFSAFANDAAFVAKHLEPLPFVYQSKEGKMITFKATDGKAANGFLLKTAKKSNKFLFVFQEWWGLNDHIKQEAEKYFNTLGDVNVIAIDLYDGKVATTREEAGTYMQAAEPARLEAIIGGAIKYAGKNAKIATVGWCFGGSWSLNASLLAKEKAVACIIYYGMPTKDIDLLKTLKAPVLGIFGSEDKWINPEVVADFEKNMQTAGKQVTIKMYEADHAFANPSNPKFKQDDAQQAYSQSIEFLQTAFSK